MTTSLERARTALLKILGPHPGYGRGKFWLASGAASAGISSRRASGIYYNEARSITAEEILGLEDRAHAILERERERERLQDECRQILDAARRPGRGKRAGRGRKRTDALG